MASSGMGCTGPVGPEGRGGSCGALAFFLLWREVLCCEVLCCCEAARAKLPVPRTAMPSTKGRATLFHLNPVLITNNSSRAMFWGGTQAVRIRFYHRNAFRYHLLSHAIRNVDWLLSCA